MSSTDASRRPAAPPAPVDWTLRSLIARHKRFAIGTLVAIIAMAAAFAYTVAQPGAGTVTDRTTCSAWGSANQNQQRAYAVRYVREHGALRGGATGVASVIASINTGCGQAFDNDVEDTVDVYHAINDQY